jgi:hypothetical protein
LNARQVQRLEERALIDRALAEERDGDAVGVALLRGQSGADRWRTALGDDPAAREVDVGIEEMHVAAFPLAEAGLAAEDLGGHPLQVDALRDGDVVGSVGSRDRVVVPQVLADARAGRLVTRGEVQLAGNRPGGDVERGLFPLEILLLKALFVVTRCHHLLVHPL